MQGKYMLKKSIQNIKVGIPVIAGRSWFGGVYYIVNLIKAVNSLPSHKKPHLYLVVKDFFLQELDLYSEILSTVDAVFFVGENKKFEAYLNAGKVIIPAERYYSFVNDEEMLAELDVYYPATTFHQQNEKYAHWIGDFQHLHFPEFFAAATVAGRENNYQKISEISAVVVVSSSHAKHDYQKLYPNSNADIKLLQFHVPCQKSWYQKDYESVIEKYNLPNNYFICCNQFWKHKNHSTLFKAVAKLKKEGTVVQVVCSGLKEDYRNKDYYNEILQLINDLAISDQIHILGHIPRHDQIQMIRGSYALIQPSLFEGWSTVVEDARILGKKIILSDIEVHLEQNPVGGIYFKQKDAADLANKIFDVSTKFLSAPDLQAEKRARNDSEKMMRAYAEQFIEIINSVLENRGISVMTDKIDDAVINDYDTKNNQIKAKDLPAEIINRYREHYDPFKKAEWLESYRFFQSGSKPDFNKCIIDIKSNNYEDYSYGIEYNKMIFDMIKSIPKNDNNSFSADIGCVSGIFPTMQYLNGFDTTIFDVREVDTQGVKGINSAVLDFTSDIIPAELQKKFHLVSCISTIEHIGLGRYGDKIDPDGDFKMMDAFEKILSDDGFLLISFPIGPACVLFNLHRIYSQYRIDKLFKDFEIVKILNFDERMFLDNDLGDDSNQPIYLLRKKRATDLDSCSSLNKKAKELAINGNTDIAIEKFHQVLQKDPLYFETNFNLGVLYSQQNEKQKALTHYLNCLKTKPYDRNVVINTVYLLDAMQNHSEAKLLLDGFMDRNNDDAEMKNLYQLFDTDLKENNTDKESGGYQDAVKLLNFNGSYEKISDFQGKNIYLYRTTKNVNHSLTSYIMIDSSQRMDNRLFHHDWVVRELERRGHQVIRLLIDIQQSHNYNDLPEMTNHLSLLLSEVISKESPDVFYVSHGGRFWSREMVEMVKSKGVLTAIYPYDDVMLFDNISRQLAPSFDIVFNQPYLKGIYAAELGIETVDLPYGANPDIVNGTSPTQAERQKYQSDVFITGSVNGSRKRGRLEYLEAFANAGMNAAYFGYSLPEQGRYESLFRGSLQSETAENLVYRSGKIAFSLSQQLIGCEYNCYGANTHTVTAKMFDGAAAGCLVLSDKFADLDLFFKDDEIVTYDNIEDAVQKAAYYLDNPEEADRIAKKGQQRVLENYTIKNVVDIIEEHVKMKMVQPVITSEMHKKGTLNLLFVQHSPGIRLYKMAKALQRKGHKITLAYTHKDISENYDLDLSIFVRRIKLDSLKEYLNVISEFDLVHTFNETDVLAVAAQKQGTKVIHDIADLTSLRDFFNSEKHFLEGTAIKNSDGVTFSTKHQQEKALSLYGFDKNKSVVINNLVSESDKPVSLMSKLSDVDGKVHMVYEGGIGNTPHRNYLQLFSTLGQVQGLELHILPAKSTDGKELRTALAKFPNIHFYQPVPPAEMIEFMSQFDVGIIPFVIYKENFEFLNTTIANKLYEYLAAGLPVVTSNLDTYREYFQHNPVGYCFEDVEKLVHKLVPLINETKELDLTQYAVSFEEKIGDVEQLYYNLMKD